MKTEDIKTIKELKDAAIDSFTEAMGLVISIMSMEKFEGIIGVDDKVRQNTASDVADELEKIIHSCLPDAITRSRDKMLELVKRK